MDLDPLVLECLHCLGPLDMYTLTRELNESDFTRGLIGGCAVWQSLKRLRASGRVVESCDRWEWQPEREAKWSERTIQTELF